MTFACQKNAYLKELISRVVSCTAVKDNLYEVILDDTVLFPEGGGQPDDRGKIGDVNVQKVLRRGATAIHIVDQLIEEGHQYKCIIDWTRRFDHMQQHSGQHLLSAIADAKFGFHTTSWDLGRKISHVELNTSKITDQDIEEIERECNERIRERLSVITHYLTKEEAFNFEEVKTRGLPDDHVGPIRLVEIEGVEKNMCCGTHVTNLSHIQVIKLLHTETMRGGTRLFFLAGDRVISKLASAVNNEQNLTKILSCGPEDHITAVDKIQKNVRSVQKTCKSYLKEVAKLEALHLKDITSKKGYVCHHRNDGDMDYINNFMNEIQTHCKGCLLFLSVGEVKSGGQFVLIGPDHKVSELGSKICNMLDGKGGGKKGRFQGKAGSYKQIAEATKLIENSCQ